MKSPAAHRTGTIWLQAFVKDHDAIASSVDSPTEASASVVVLPSATLYAICQHRKATVRTHDEASCCYRTAREHHVRVLV